MLKRAIDRYFALRAVLPIGASACVLPITGTQTGRTKSIDTRDHAARIGRYDAAFCARLQGVFRKAFPSLYQEGRRSAYGLVYLRCNPRYKEETR